jgi:hypothetical protein
VVLASVVKPKGASAAASVVSRIYASDAKRVPGLYKNSLLSTVERHSEGTVWVHAQKGGCHTGAGKSLRRA